jgi:hypothetical protein
LYSDTSITATGSSLFQIQNGEERLIAYHSKKLPDACKRYGISELELTGIYLNIHAFRYLLKSTNFEVYTDHSSLCNILKSKHEPPNDRFKKLIEKLSAYTFKIGYRKGSELVIADYLSRNVPEDEDIGNDISPIAFEMLDISTFYPLAQKVDRPITRAYARAKGIEVKPLYKEKLKTNDRNTEISNTSNTDSSDTSLKTVFTDTHVRKTPVGHGPNIPSNDPNTTYEQFIDKPVQSPILDKPIYKQNTLINANSYDNCFKNFKNLIPEDNDKNDIFETHTKPEKFYYNNNKPLFESIKDDGILRNHIPKQNEIDKMLDIIRKKVLRDYHLPLNFREIRKMQENDSYLGPILKILEQSCIPTDKKSYRKLTNLAEDFILINGILFRINLKTNSECNVLLAVPEVMVPTILHIYHDSLLGNHQGINRSYQTIRKKFFIHNLYQKLYDFVRTCNICQSRKTPNNVKLDYVPRIPTDFRPLKDVSCDIKHMVSSYTGHKYLLIIVCNITRYVIAEPLIKCDSMNIAEIMLNRLVFRFGPPNSITMDSDRALENKVMNYIYNSLDIKTKIISPYNHGSLITERFCQTISNLILSNLTETGQNWPLFVQSAVYSYNTFSIPSLENYSPHYLVHLNDIEPVTPLNLAPIPNMGNMKVQVYVESLRDRLNNVAKRILDKQAANQYSQYAKQNLKTDNKQIFSEGLIVFLLAPSASSLQTASKKLRLDFCGPLYIFELLDQNHVILADMQGHILKGIFNIRRLKPGFIRSDSGTISNINQLKYSLKTSDKHDKESLHSIMENQDMKGTDNENLIFSAVSLTEITLQKGQENDNKVQDVKLSVLSENRKRQLLKLDKSRSNLTGDYVITRGRFKYGNLELLFNNVNDNKTTFWLSPTIHPFLIELVKPLINDNKLKISGSSNRFFKVCLY